MGCVASWSIYLFLNTQSKFDFGQSSKNKKGKQTKKFDGFLVLHALADISLSI